jgi:hypothetical protein
MSETPVAAWSRCQTYIEAALTHAGGGYLIEDVRTGIEAGDYHFWVGSRCAVVTEFQDQPQQRVLNFWLLGGDPRELLGMLPHIERWAKVHGCSKAIGGGVHRGWKRLLARFGYSPSWVIYSKELT